MSPTQARAFYAVASSGSFTAAAKSLNVSQPTITTQVRELEELYGVELFYRHPRGVVLTDTGRQLLVIIRRWHANQKDAVEYLQTVRDLRSGHLRIGSYGPYDVVDILTAFTQRYPSLTTTLTFGNSQKLRDDLINNSLDVAVFSHLDDTPEFHSFSFSRNEAVLIAHKGHHWGDRKSIELDELCHERFIIREAGSEVRRIVEEVVWKSGVNLRNIMEVGSREGTIAAVGHGIGVSLLFDQGPIPNDLITKYHIKGVDVVAEVDVVCHEERKNSRIIGSFLSVAQDLIAANRGAGQASS